MANQVKIQEFGKNKQIMVIAKGEHDDWSLAGETELRPKLEAE